APPQRWGVFVDWDQDGHFAASEQVWQGNSTDSSMLSGEIPIPADAALGITRLRVVMQRNQAPDACGSYLAGETEDFCLDILAGVGTVGNLLPGLQIFPNPTADAVTLKAPDRLHQVDVLDLTGRRLTTWRGRHTQVHLRLGDLSPGLYLLKIQGAGGHALRKVMVE
ncbi:MAG: T9SS C-terminal target domain-containing protein, partial [Bacteroidetes bacterium]